MAEDFEAEDAEYEEYTFTPSVITENGREVIDYTGVESDRVLLSNRRDILSLPRPSWMPELDGAGLAADHYLPVTVHDDEGNYYLQSRIRTGEEEKTVTNYGISRTVIEPVYETKIYKLKLDVLVATVDYYIKHERAVLTSKAATPEVAKALCREVGIPRAAHTMSWQRYLDSVALLGFCRNYRESEDPLVKRATELPAKKGRDRTAVGKKQNYLVFTEQHGPLLQAFRDKKLDLNLQKQEYIDTHAKGEDTSYGNVNCWNTFRDEYGILIKKQNGKDFTRKTELEAIRTAVSDVWSYYGNLTAEAGKYNLVLSYADNCNQHARKVCGLFHPLYHAIGVSFFKDISDPEHSRMSPSEILVHETTHWLDSLKGRETHNWYASDVSGTLENRIAELYKNELRSYVKSPRNKDKKKLGDYWYRTCECLARAVEQDFALSHGISFDEPGYLPEDIYKERVQPLVKELLEENRRHFNLTMPEKASEISEKKENPMEYTLTDTLKERLEKEADNIYFYNVKDIVNEKNRKGFEADVTIPENITSLCGAPMIGEISYHVSRKGQGVELKVHDLELLTAGGIDEEALKVVLEVIVRNARNADLEALRDISEEDCRKFGGFTYKNMFGQMARVRPAKEQLEENIRYITGGYFNAMTDDPENSRPLSVDDLYAMCVPDIYDMVASGGYVDYADGICRHLRFLGSDYIRDTVLRIGQEEQVLVAESQSLTKETRIREWYEKTYPNDASIVSSLSPDATFGDLEKAVIEDRYNWNPRYDARDSAVRERFFTALSAINGESYEVIYNKWLDSSKGLHDLRYGLNWDGRKYRLPEPEEQLLLNAVEILSMLQNNYQPGPINGTVSGEPLLTVEQAREYTLKQVYDIYSDGQGGLTQKDGISSYLRALSPYKTLEIIDDAILKTCTTPSYLLDGERERIEVINAMLNDENLTRIHEHGRTEFWSDRTMASSFYSSAMIACDGSEAEQYRKVFADLTEGKSLCLGEDIPYDKYPDYRARFDLVTDVCSCDRDFNLVNVPYQKVKQHQINMEHGTTPEITAAVESFIFDRLSAAGIEVITVKDEFDRILAEENIVQKMTVNGDIYGFVHNGKIYLNPEFMNSNVAVQEYTHLWDAYTQKTNPELWNKGLNLFKDTKYWNEVISDPNYQDIKDDENLVLSEIHSRICGDIAEKVLERIAELDGEQVKLDAIDWDKETWAYIATNIGFHTFDNVDPELKIKTSELRDFLSTPMKDLMAGKKITKALHEHNPELSENRTFILDGASNGMLSKYTGRTDISELEDFRNYASSRITGTAGDNSYFAQLYLLGQEWCKEKGLPLPEPALSDSPAPVSITAFSKALSETSPLPPSEPAVSQEESRPSVQSVSGTDAAGLPFNLYFNEEKGRYNIKFDPENNGDFFGDIVGELKANGWKYAPSFKNWFPLKVEGSEEFAKSLLEKYSARIQASLDKLQEASAALGAALKEPSGPSDPVSEAVCLIPLDSAPARLKYFDRNHNESSEFMTYFNGHLSSFGPLAADLSEADASRILKALGHVSKSTLDEREERLALDSDNNPVIVSRTKDGTRYMQANLPGLIDFAVRLSEKTVSDTKAYLDQYDPAKIACGDMFRDIYADLYNENRLILNDIRDIASRYLSEESLSYEAVQNAKKAELERKHEPYVVVNWTERSGDEFIPSGTVYTLNEAETKLPELDAKFSQFIKADFSLVLPMPDASGAFTAESDISYDFRWDLGTGHPVASLNDYIMMCCSYPEVIEAYEENWKRVNVPGISDKRVSEIDGVLDELATSVRSSLDSKLSSLGSALSEAKAVGNQVISDVNDYERAKKEVMKCKKEINDCYVKAALSAVRRLESSPIGYRTDGDENIHKYVNHAIKNFINDLMYSESRKADNPHFDKELWEESLTVVEDITDEKLDAYLLSAEQWFKPAPDAAVAFKERFEAEVRNDDCTRDGLYRISKKILGSFSKEQKSEISIWLSQEPFMSAGLVKTLSSWLPDDLQLSFIKNEEMRPDGCEKIMPEKHDKKKNAGRDDLLSR